MSWSQSFVSTPIHPKDHRRELKKLRDILANPNAAGLRKGIFYPYSNFDHYSRLKADCISEWHPAF